MTEMVERVARALAEKEGFCWENCAQCVWIDDARAAIAAMREPTEAMLGPPWNYGRLEIWQAMIDEALQGTP